MSVSYDLKKLQDGDICHALRQKYAHPLKKGDRIIIFHKNSLLIGISEIKSIRHITLDEFEFEGLYSLLGYSKEEWEEERKKLGRERSDYVLVEWKDLEVFKKGIS
jgi:hypothetical protein